MKCERENDPMALKLGEIESGEGYIISKDKRDTV